MSGFNGDLTKLDALVRNLGKLAAVPEDTARDASKTIHEYIEDEYNAGTSPNGGAWAALSDSTRRRGRTPPPLTHTHHMRDTTKVEPLPGGGIAVSSEAPYARFHVSGTSRMPARPIVPSGVFPEKWSEAIEAAANASVEKIVKGT